MQLAVVESSIIAYRGYDPSTQVMEIVFKDRASGSPTGHYEYAAVGPQKWNEGLTADSFGSWFQRDIKPFPKNFPYRKLADQYGEVQEGVIDFASHQPIPATLPGPEAELPKDIDGLKTAANDLLSTALVLLPENQRVLERLNPATNRIAINGPEDRARFATMTLALARMQKAALDTYNDEESEMKKAYNQYVQLRSDRDALAKPLDTMEKIIKNSIGDYDFRVRKAEEEQARKLREEEQRKADEEAKERARTLQLEDAIAAEATGDIALADSIMASAPLPIAPRYVAPAILQSAVPANTGVETYIGYGWEVVKIDDIPRMYMIQNDEAIGSVVEALGMKAAIPGIRVFEKPMTRRTGKKGRISA